ncbi:hypothetical protein Droror1_Dr00016785 [Drosera rotundifolia]
MLNSSSNGRSIALLRVPSNSSSSPSALNVDLDLLQHERNNGSQEYSAPISSSTRSTTAEMVQQQQTTKRQSREQLPSFEPTHSTRRGFNSFNPTTQCRC